MQYRASAVRARGVAHALSINCPPAGAPRAIDARDTMMRALAIFATLVSSATAGNDEQGGTPVAWVIESEEYVQLLRKQITIV